jgi:hypothetical protein
VKLADSFLQWGSRQPWPIRWLLGVLVMALTPVIAVGFLVVAIPLLVFDGDCESTPGEWGQPG